jgi:hypothetical protein
MVLVYKLELIQQLIIHPFPEHFQNKTSNFPYSTFLVLGLGKETGKENSQHLKSKFQQQSDFIASVQDFIKVIKTIFELHP